MEKTKLCLLISRGLQFLLAIVITSVAIGISKDIKESYVCRDGSSSCKSIAAQAIASFGFSAFVGGFGVIDSIGGIAAEFIDVVPWIAVIALDGLAALFYAAAGICVAVARGSWNRYGGNFYTRSYLPRWTTVNVFCFFALLVTIGAIVQVMLRRRAGKGGGGGGRDTGVATL